MCAWVHDRNQAEAASTGACSSARAEELKCIGDRAGGVLALSRKTEIHTEKKTAATGPAHSL
jgi:hypothetical protein